MSENKKIFATPKIRKFARELGANIGEIEGSERAGRITEEDVKNYINNKPIKNPIFNPREHTKTKSLVKLFCSNSTVSISLVPCSRSY